ncbi:MAG TPA: cytochrome P450, partial [Anaerolineae bacterium]|nr:cytochrome P450 [Anaerolineae bacterium]
TGPKGSTIPGVLPQFLRNPLDLIERSAAEYGDIVTLRFFHRRAYFLNHPDYIRHVLVDNNQNYVKGRGSELTRPVIGEGLLTSEGEFHQRQRRLMQPAFHRRQIAALAETMTAFAERHIAPWREGETRDLHAEMMGLTMSIVTQSLFGVDVASENSALAETLDELMKEFSFADATPLGQLLLRLPTARVRRRAALLGRLDKAIYGFIRAGRERPEACDDLLSLLLTAQDSEGDGLGMSDRQVRDEVMTLFIAGHETTANAITWTFYLLAQHPDLESRLQVELSEVLGGRSPSIEDVPSLKYTRMVLSEAMRLYPPAWIMSRLALAEDEIGGYRIPAQSPILISQWAMHRHPAYWDEPLHFNPERFNPDDPAVKQRPRYTYFPFGGGPRLCIGEPFAWMEGILLIAALAQRFCFRLAPSARVEPQPLVTLRPKYGLPITLH